MMHPNRVALMGAVIVSAPLVASDAIAAVYCRHVDTETSSGARYVTGEDQLRSGAAHAELSNAIYGCRGICQGLQGKWGRWDVLLDSRQQSFVLRKEVNSQTANTGMAGSTPAVIEIPLDPDGFHATAYRKVDGSAIVLAFEGTSSLEDWKTNAGMVLWKPEQFSKAEYFARSVIDAACGSDRACLATISVTGHSLGGALAQHVGLMYGLSVFTFNAAGLFAPSQADLAAASRLGFSGRHFFSQGYRIGSQYGGDVVPHLGKQFAQDTCEVPVRLPAWAWDAVTVELVTHNMERLSAALTSELNATSASKNTVSPPGVPVCVPAPVNDPAPWEWISRVLDSFPHDVPGPTWAGSFGDAHQLYQLDLWRDSAGIFGEFRNPVLEADSPTSRLYDVQFDPASGALEFRVRVPVDDTWFSGTLRNDSVTGTLRYRDVSEAVQWRRLPDVSPPNSSHDFYWSRAKFECAMTLWHRY